MSWGGPPGQKPPGGANPWGQAPGQAPHPVSPQPYMGQAPGHPPHPVSPAPYMPPQQQVPPQGQMPPQPQGGPMMAPPQQGQGPRTVFGFPLEPGERVLYYRYISGTGARIFYALFGIPAILIIGLGFFLIYLAITHRKQFTYAQVLTNRRMFLLDGRGQERQGIRWENVAGLNKVTTSVGGAKEFGVRNGAGAQVMFTEDLEVAERMITQLVQNPAAREAMPEVPFDAQVH